MSRGSLRRLAYFAFALNALIIMGVFWHIAGAEAFRSWGNFLIAAGNICGLLGAYTILVQLVLVVRVPLLEKGFGMEALTKLHRKNGELSFSLILVHPFLLVFGYNLIYHSHFWAQFVSFVTDFPDVANALIGTVMLCLVVYLSITIARKKLKYEAWYLVHLSTYLTIILTFSHQLSSGPDFIGHPWFQFYWYLLYGITAMMVIMYRIGQPLWLSWQHRFVVDRIVQETPDTYSIYVSGRNIPAFQFEPGQFAIWRFLGNNLGWQAHPFSFSQEPGLPYLRLTFKGVGDFTRILHKLPVGTPIILDGPHGDFVAEPEPKKVAFVAGGSGITPLRSMLPQLLAQGADVVLLYAARSRADLVLADELEALRARYGFAALYAFSTEAHPSGIKGYLDEGIFRQYVPDIASRQVFLCCPAPMMKAVRGALTAVGLPENQLHSEVFSF